jgi:signal transduction histidine kinase
VAISAPETLPPLPAAVEVAGYRIITEAMTNAARHSGATRIDVRLTLAGDGLCIEVCDDGGTTGGAGEAWQPGFGLISMRERAAELGGSCQAGPDPGGGGRVTARLPLTQAQAERAGRAGPGPVPPGQETPVPPGQETPVPPEQAEPLRQGPAELSAR